MESEKRCDIVICAGCVRRNTALSGTTNHFTESIYKELLKRLPDVHWTFKTNSCLRLCPDNKISLTVNRRLSMSREPTPQSVISEILSLSKDMKK